MSALLPGILALILYIGIAIAQFLRLRNPERKIHNQILGAGFLAVTLHGIEVYADIIRPDGTNIGIFAMASLIAWSAAVTVLLSSLRKPLDNLFIFLFPLAALSIKFALLNSEPTFLKETVGDQIFAHILLSILSYSFLTIAAFHALILLYANRLLKSPGKMSLLKALPPLQTMEVLLFELLWVGAIFLTLTIASGFLFLDDMFAQRLAHHTIITLAAWVVYAILLWGRYRLGWRGSTAINWTLAGFFLLLLGYFGTKLVIEIILHRT
jgi:ABC-type uncharacterized transport system permease subunit